MVRVLIDGKEEELEKMPLGEDGFMLLKAPTNKKEIKIKEYLLLVPKEIQFVGYGIIHGLKVGKHWLEFNKGNSNWEFLTGFCDYCPIPCKLVSCKKEDLNTGEPIYIDQTPYGRLQSNPLLSSLKNSGNYGFYLGEEKYVSVEEIIPEYGENKKFISVREFELASSDKVWRVVPLTEEEIKTLEGN
jgi:hypothetical protein